MSEIPAELQELDRTMRAIRFSPRSSLGAELLGRVRRGEQPGPSGRPLLRPLMLVLTAVAAAAAIMLIVPSQGITVDRCCYDLDGGGDADDGVLVIARRNGPVRRLSIYEDQDRSGHLTPDDIIRFTRYGHRKTVDWNPPGLTTITHCCQDLDGGGPADDGVVVVGTPPDHVAQAAIYEVR
ncbi:MAG: hypothetical protein H0T58_13465 [Gemmatimonadales bacterium]|nr:hypothetical protein [Gemmatimonadales bacterium]